MSTQESQQSAFYSVKQASELTGLTLNQIRLWERRYQLILPNRDANGYRQYTLEDLDILRYTAQRLQSGYSIATISKEVSKGRSEVIQKIRSKTPCTVQKIRQHELGQIANFELMLNALEIGNPLKFEQLLVQASAGRSFAQALCSVDLPILSKVEEQVLRSKLPRECFEIASAIVRRRVLAHIANLDIPARQDPLFLACAPEDKHELTLLCNIVELARHLLPTIYHGPRFNLKELAILASKQRPAGFLMFINQPHSAEQTEALALGLKENFKTKWPVAVYGFEADRQREIFAKYQIPVFGSVDEVLDWQAVSLSLN